MSANCPPQLQLSIDIQPSTTSFKRSFEQFGFDLDSPVITGPEDLVATTTELDTAGMNGHLEGRSPGAAGIQQNTRRGNKRPRSASSFSSESSSSASASTSSGRSGMRSEASTSSASSTSSPPNVHHPSSIRAPNRTRIHLLSPSPPRLPTPEIQDIEMPAEYSTTTARVIEDHRNNSNPPLLPIPIPIATHAAHASSTSFAPSQVHYPQPQPASRSSSPPQQPTPEDMFRLSLERFNAFDTEISALRQPDNPPSLSLSLGLGLLPITNATEGIRAGTTRLISPAPVPVDRRHSRTPPPTLPLLPIQVEGDDQSAMILPEVLPTPATTTAPVSAIPISTLASSASPSILSTNRGPASTAASNHTTTNTLDFHVPTSPFANHLFLPQGFVERTGEEEERRTGRLIMTPTEEEEEEVFENNATPSSFRFREHLQDHLREQQHRRHRQMPFRDRLDTALARLRSQSPLVPGIGSSSSEASGERESEESEESGEGDHWEDTAEHEEEEEQSEEYEQVAVPPPTLPPIPTIATASTSAQGLWEGELLFSTVEGDTTASTIPAPSRARTPPTEMGLSDHPLPSPLLRDLHSWMGEGESGPAVSGHVNGSSGIVGQPERHMITNNSNLNNTGAIIPNYNIINTSNIPSTGNTSTAARAASPSTSTTSTSTVRPSSVVGGFAGFAAFGGPSEVSAPPQSAYQGSSIFGGNSGRSGADDFRLTDPRLPSEVGQDRLPMFVGRPHEQQQRHTWGASPLEVPGVTGSNSRLRERRSVSPPPRLQARFRTPRFRTPPDERLGMLTRPSSPLGERRSWSPLSRPPARMQQYGSPSPPPHVQLAALAAMARRSSSRSGERRSWSPPMEPYDPESTPPHIQLAALAAMVTRSSSRSRERPSWSPSSPPNLRPQSYESQSPPSVSRYRDVSDTNNNAAPSNHDSNSNDNTTTATANNNTSALDTADVNFERDFAIWFGPPQNELPRSRESEEAEEDDGIEEDDDDDDMVDEDERDRRLRANILSTRRLPRPEEFSAGFSSSLSGAVGETQNQNQQPNQNQPENSNRDSSPRPPTTRSNSSRSYQRSMRPGSSNSLVTENAAEARRRADRAQAEEWASGRRSDPPARSPWPHLQGILTAEGENQLRDSPWGAELLERIGATEQNRRSRSRSPPPDRRRASIAVDPGMAMDVSEDPPRRNSAAGSMTSSGPVVPTFEDWLATPPVFIPRSPPPRSPILDFWHRPNYFPRRETATPTDPPSLPPPDLGGSFDSGSQIASSNPDTQAFYPDRSYLSGPLRHHQRSHAPWTPLMTPQLPPPPPLTGLSSDRSNDRDGNNSQAVPSQPTLIERIPIVSSYEERERARSIIHEARRRGFEDRRRANEDDSGDDDNMSTAHDVVERMQRTLHSIRSMPRPPQPPVETNSSRPTVPSNPFSSSDYMDSVWSSGNGSGAARTQRDTTSPGHNLPQLPLASSSFTLDTFNTSSFVPGPIRNTMQQLVDEHDRDRFRGSTASTSTSIPVTSQPSSFTTQLAHQLGQMSNAVPHFRRMPLYRPPNPLPPSIPPLSFDGDNDAGGGRAGGTDMDVVDMGFSPSSAAPSSRPAIPVHTTENPNTSRTRRYSGYARGLGTSIPITISRDDSSNNAGRERLSGRESLYARRSFIPELGPLTTPSSGDANPSGSRVSNLQNTASPEMHRYISAQARMADALSATRPPASRPSAAGTTGTDTSTSSANANGNTTPLDSNTLLGPFTSSEAGRRRQLLQRYNIDRMRQREREREPTSGNANPSPFRSSFPPIPPTNTVRPTPPTAAEAIAARLAVVQQNERRDRDERLLSLQSHMARGRRGRFGGTTAGANSSNDSGAGPRSSSGGFSSGSNVPPQHQHPLTLQNFEYWHTLQSEAAGWGGPGGDGPAGAAARRGRGGRARMLGDYMRDEDFDESYESLISLAAALGEAKPRGAPSEVVEKMEKGKYKDWKTEESDVRCPICLDDYEPDDPVLKLNNCSHWLHQECLNQWLQTASTCPVCRKSVNNSASGSGSSFGRRHFHHHHVLHRHAFGAGPGPGVSMGIGLGPRRRERETADREHPSGPVTGPGGRDEVGRRSGLGSGSSRFGATGGTGPGRSTNRRSGDGNNGNSNGDGRNSANANEQGSSANNDDSTSGSRRRAPGWGAAPWR